MLRALILTLFVVPSAWAVGEAVGSYTDGTLENGICIPAEGQGYMQLYRDVGHIWATRPLMQTVVCAAQDMDTRFPNRDRMQVEEMSAKHGGDIEGHGSHENGLDVDIQYYKKDGKEHVPSYSQYYAQPMADEATGKISANFDVARNWELAKTLMKCGDVGRIFMNQHLKNQLCLYAASIGEYKNNIEVLRRIRHEANHADHMHVRLECPKTDRRCRKQPLPPAGSGCP